MTTSDSIDYAVIGAGPAGLAAALLIMKTGSKVVVFEGLPEIPTNNAESYPIGVNPRGQQTFEAISSSLREEFDTVSVPIDGWRIVGSGRLIVAAPSGGVRGTTRGDVVSLLYRDALRSGLDVRFGHKLSAIDFDEKVCKFETHEGLRSHKVQRVIAADGCWSRCRREMERHMGSSFHVETFPWNVKFRNIVGKDDTVSDKPMDGTHFNSRWHSIYNPGGAYAAIIKGQKTADYWMLALSCPDDDDDREEQWLLDEEVTSQNVERLKGHVAKCVPDILGVLDESSYAAFFHRQTKGGIVVKCSHLNCEEFLVLIGDAAHSLFPATGEGVNSSLEDANILAQCIREDESCPFAAFDARRRADVHAIADLAAYFTSQKKDSPWERKMRVISTILSGICKKLGLFSTVKEDYLFGDKANEARSYAEIIDSWKKQMSLIRPVCALIAGIATCCTCCGMCEGRKATKTEDEGFKNK